MEKIAGDICLSEDPGRTMRKWRETFHLSQQRLAEHLGMSPSVVSDYESGRRRSPGVATVRRFVEAFIQLDAEGGSQIISKYTGGVVTEAVLAIGEFQVGVGSQKVMDAIEGENLTKVHLKREIYGYTVLDSLKTIMTLSAADYLKVYGWNSERALIFTEVSLGRSPMIAVRAHPLKPAMVVYIKPEKVDPLAIRLAELERIPLIVTDLGPEPLVKRLQRFK